MNQVFRLLLSAAIASASSASPAAEPAPAAAAPAAPRQAGVDVPKPERVKVLRPTYPPEALARGQHALVVVELVIDENGKVAEARVLHGPEPFAQAALEAARQWEYKPTVVDGKRVRVKETVPITFSLPAPAMKREEGIPEMRQGVAPRFPPRASGGPASVVADVEVDGDGRIRRATVQSGEPPFSDAVLEATRTWRFASAPDGKGLTFTVHASFKDGKVALEAKGPRTTTDAAAAAGDAVTAPPAATSAPTPLVADGNTSPAVAEAPADAVEAAPPAVVSDEPLVEVVSGGGGTSGSPALPADAASPPAPPENGMSSVRDVELDAGIPDLVRGRRPVSPPLARMADIEGPVEVRFSIDSGGATTVQSTNGHEQLKPAAESLVRSWAFRRTSPHRVFALALIEFKTLGSKARIRPVP